MCRSSAKRNSIWRTGISATSGRSCWADLREDFRMATVPPHVQPGQLILANHWNAMVDVLTELKTIVDSLGVGGVATGPPVIVTIQPSEQPPIGTEITLMGSGFGVPIENTVTIASV